MSIRFAAMCVAMVGGLAALTPAEGFADTVYPTRDVTITFSGRVTSGTDVTGVFGQAGADLTGQRYELSYELRAVIVEPYSVAEYDGSRHEYFSDEFLSYFSAVNMRINNRDYAFASSDWSYAMLNSGFSPTYWPGGLAISLASNNSSPTNSAATIWDYSTAYQTFSDPSDHVMRSLLTPMVRRAAGPSTGTFDLVRLDYGPDWNNTNVVLSAYGKLDAQWMRITGGGIAPVPLPASVGPFLLALGLGGIFAWRRRQGRGEAPALRP